MYLFEIPDLKMILYKWNVICNTINKQYLLAKDTLIIKFFFIFLWYFYIIIIYYIISIVNIDRKMQVKNIIVDAQVDFNLKSMNE